MSKQIYGVTTGSSVEEIKARAKKLGFGVPVFPGDGSLAAVLAHIKALDIGYQTPAIIAGNLFKSHSEVMAASKVAHEYHATIYVLTGDLTPADEKAQQASEKALRAAMTKYGVDQSVVKQVLGRAPYGYVRTKRVLAIDEGAAALITTIFEHRDNGETLEEILSVVLKKFKEATTTSTGERWHKARVARILRRVDMYRLGKFRDCDGRHYTDRDLVIIPPKAIDAATKTKTQPAKSAPRKKTT